MLLYCHRLQERKIFGEGFDSCKKSYVNNFNKYILLLKKLKLLNNYIIYQYLSPLVLPLITILFKYFV